MHIVLRYACLLGLTRAFAMRNSLLSGGEEWRFDDEDDVISEDRARLMRRLETYSLCERQVKGDGNCQV